MKSLAVFGHFTSTEIPTRSGMLRDIYKVSQSVMEDIGIDNIQGYYVKPRDGSHFVKLFADAQFYSRE